MKSPKHLLLLLSFLPLAVWAQEKDSVDFTSDLFGGLSNVDVLPKGRLQLETYAFYEHSELLGVNSHTWSPFASVLRYGLNNTTELTLQGAWLHTTDEGENYTGFSNLAVGFKTRLFEGWKAVPAIAIQGQLYIPGGENYVFLPDNFGFEFDLIFSNQLTSWCTLGYQGTLIWDDQPRPTIFFGVSLDLQVTDRFSMSVEQTNSFYGVNEGKRYYPWIGLSMFYQLLPRLQLGVGSEISLRDTHEYANVMLGVAWQLTRR